MRRLFPVARVQFDSIVGKIEVMDERPNNQARHYKAPRTVPSSQEQPGEDLARSASVSTRSFISMYAAQTRFERAVASKTHPGRSLTWRIYLPVPSNKPAGSASSAPRKNPTFT